MTETANPEQFELWNGESGLRWVDNADRRDAVLAPVGDLLLQYAAIAPGQRVLDVGCGCGATTLAAARAAGSAGTVVGVDLSAPMLEVARGRVAAAGLDNVQVVHGDAQTVALGSRFDVALSRFGTMFFADPVAAFANIAAHLVPGGRLCMATWQPLGANEWLTVAGAVLLDFGTMPDMAGPDAPGMFAQSDPGVIIGILEAAGFGDVTTQPHTVSLDFGPTVDEAAAYLADSGPGRAILDTIADDQKGLALDALRRALAPHAQVGGVVLEGAVWVTTAALPEEAAA